jgi:hypothetical protein
MRRNASTVVVLAGPAPEEVLAAVGRSMNVALIRLADTADPARAVDPRRPGDPGRPGDPAGNGSGGLAAAAAALKRAGQASSPYALVAADPLAAVAVSWRAMWDVSRQAGPAGFEQEAARALAAWRAGVFELPDYYLVLASATSGVADAQGGSGASPASGASGALRGAETGGAPGGPDFYLGPLRAARPHRVAFVAATEPALQAAGVLAALGSLRQGPWWPGLDQLIETARTFYPDSLGGGNAAPAVGG